MKNPTRILAVLACAAAMLTACSRNDPAGLIASAKTYLAQANPKAAAIQLKNVLQQSPDRAEARFLLARALLDAGDAAGAETEARKALDLKWPGDEVYPVLARALVAQGNYARLATEFGSRTLGSPQARADVTTSLALGRLNDGNVDEAQRLATLAARDAPDDPRLLVTQAEIANRRNDPAAALRFIDQALAKHPGDVEATVLKSRWLTLQNQSDAAVKLLESALAQNPNALALRFGLASLLVNAGKLDAAGVQVVKMRELAPEDVRTQYADAMWSFGKGDGAHARDVLQHVLGTTPDHLPSLMLNGIVQYQLGFYSLAEDSLRKVVARVPGDTTARRFLAATYVKTGRAAQAIELLAPQLKAGSEDPALWRTAAEASLAAGDPLAATSYYERAAAMDDANVGTKVRLAQARMSSGETERGFHDLEALSRADPKESQADLALIAAYLQQRRYDDALASAQTVVRKQPDSATGYLVQGAVQLARRDLAGARASFDQALARNPGSVDAARNLATIDVQEGKVDAARARYEAMLAKDPNNEAVLMASAELAAVAGGGGDAARKLLERAITAQPASVRPRLALIALAMRERDVKAALASAQAAQAALPNDLQIEDALGTAQLAAGNANQAIDTFQRIVKEQPQNPLALMRLADSQAAAGDASGAIVSARKAVAVQPDFGPAWVSLTKLLLANQRGSEAIAEARRLQKERPKEAVGYLLEGEIQASQQHWTEAAAAYRLAYARRPQPLMASRVYFALTRDNKLAEAAAFAAQWNRDNPKDVTVRAIAAQQAQQRHDLAGALAGYRAALEIEPNNFVLLNNLAGLLSDMNDPAAREYAERAYRVAPFNPSVMDTLGSVLVAGGDPMRGVQLLQMAVNLTPRDPEVRLHLGKALARQGNKTAARRELEIVTRLDPKSPLRADAEKALAAL